MTRTATADHIFGLPFEYEKYVEDFFVSYKQDGIVILMKRKGDEGVVVNGNDIEITLSANETKMFSRGIAEAQMKVQTPNGKIVPSEEVEFYVNSVVDERDFDDEV